MAQQIVRREFPRDLRQGCQSETQFLGKQLKLRGRCARRSDVFGGAPQRLTVPFAALTTFVDPSVPFGLRLMGSPESEDGAEEE